MSETKGDIAPNSPDVHFEPIIQLPEIDIKTCEEDEEELLKLRAKLYRYAATETPPEWKERGTGYVKLLKHTEKGTVRLLMRRDKTLKVCANHSITHWMELKPNCGSDRAWVWSVAADFADEIPVEEMFAIKFGNVDNATLFKNAFDDCKKIAERLRADSDTDDANAEVKDLVDDLGKLDVKANGKDETTGEEKTSRSEQTNEEIPRDSTAVSET